MLHAGLLAAFLKSSETRCDASVVQSLCSKQWMLVSCRITVTHHIEHYLTLRCRMALAVVNKFGGIHGVVQCAGVATPKRVRMHLLAVLHQHIGALWVISALNGMLSVCGVGAIC